MKISVDWLKDFVSLKSSPQGVADRLTMAGLEVKKVESSGSDHVFEIEITSNRPDWLSHLGVAREISALENSRLKLLPKFKLTTPVFSSDWKLSLEDKIGCPYYSGVLIEGIQNLSHVLSRLAVHPTDARTIAREHANCGELPNKTHAGKLVSIGE